jgi:hypothetical protein
MATLTRCRPAAIRAAIGGLLVFASCDKGPTSPRLSETAPASVIATVRIELVAPAEIAPGESVQLTANAVKSDFSVENVSSKAQWTPTDSPTLQLSPTGRATGKDRGEQVISARFGGQSASARILVLPNGTFRLAGTIRETGFGIANATVTVVAGVGEGLTARSGFDGSYALYGVSGQIRVQIKREGYVTSTEQIDVPAHRNYDFNIDPERPRQDHSGTYTLTITAASACRPSPSPLPDEATRRIYTANVTQDGGRLTVTLTGADFIVSDGYGNRFSGFIDLAGTVTFALGDAYYFHYYDEHYQIVERFQGGALIVVGNVAAKETPGVISGTLAGAIATSGRTSPPYGTYGASCFAPTHRFEMVRR